LNLFENAIKYSNDGGTIRIEALAGKENIRVEIANTGKGIPEPDLPRVFDPFYRGDADRSRDNGGAGLGLAIAREIANAHNGSISITSIPERVTTVTVILPC
jgi:signal transduction histidine kinase